MYYYIKLKEEKENTISYKEIETTFSGDLTVFGVFCNVDVNKVLKNLLLEVSGNESDQFTLDDTTFQTAKMIDEKLSKLHVKFTSSPYDDDYCITPEFYTEVWR